MNENINPMKRIENKLNNLEQKIDVLIKIVSNPNNNEDIKKIINENKLSDNELQKIKNNAEQIIYEKLKNINIKGGINGE